MDLYSFDRLYLIVLDLETVFLDESVMILHTWQQQSRILHRCHEKHLCSLIDESDIVNVVSCDDIFMLTNADSLSPFEISSLSLSLCSSRGAPHGAYTGRILPT